MFEGVPVFQKISTIFFFFLNTYRLKNAKMQFEQEMLTGTTEVCGQKKKSLNVTKLSQRGQKSVFCSIFDG